MNFFQYSLAILVLIVFDAQTAQHPAENLARAYIALVGERYGKESNMSKDLEAVLDTLYSDTYTVISDDEVIVSSRADFKKHLEKAKGTAGLWRVTDVVYAPDATDTRSCKIAFRWWTEKNGVFDVQADMQSSNDGKRIEFIEETTDQVYTASEVS
jgi:hypothetical protein